MPIKKAAKFFWESRDQFLRYAVVGTSGTALDLGSLHILRNLLGWSPTLSVVVNQVFIIAYNFSLNKYWSFKSQAMPHQQFVRYLALTAMNYAVAVGVMHFFAEIRGYDALLVRVVNIVASVAWNFALFKKWVYKT
ncbi:GtrA family protein [Candidatus Nomurabacteria bacterium]|nr:GtrA family protein [Candidatus Nomurabacteria bacterium]